MKDLMETFFGPLNKDACHYFYIWSIVFAILFVTTLSGMVFSLVKNFKKHGQLHFMQYVMILINIGFGYFANRLFHTMCVRSLV